MATQEARDSFQIDVAQEPVTTIFSRGEAAVVDHKLDADEEILVALGYKQEFKRKFTIWTSFSVSFSVLGLLPSVAATLGYILGYQQFILVTLILQICRNWRCCLGVDNRQHNDSIRCFFNGGTLL